MGHFTRLTAELPRDWTADPTGTFDYVGADGFVASQPVAGRSLDGACSTLAASPRFDVAATGVDATWSGRAACRIDGRIEGADAAGFVMPHPHPFELWGDRFAHAGVIAAPEDLDAIVATVDFSPDRVTPDAYMTSSRTRVLTRSRGGGRIADRRQVA